MNTHPASSERTLSCTIIRAPLSEVDEAIKSVLSKIARKGFQRFEAPLDIFEIYAIDPPPGGAHPFKLVIYSPRECPECTVFISNRADGWNSLCYLLAEKHKAFQVQVTSTRDDVKYPKHMIQVWQAGQSTRIVMVLRDSDKWVFSERGELQNFEEKEFYSNRFVKKRLNRVIIRKYLKKIGFNIECLEFWQSIDNAVYFEEAQKNE